MGVFFFLELFLSVCNYGFSRLWILVLFDIFLFLILSLRKRERERERQKEITKRRRMLNVEMGGLKGE